jgi:hypothetical protein
MIRFRLYPKENTSLYAIVNVHDTKEQMLKKLKPSQRRPTLRAFEAGTVRRLGGRKLPIFTELHFHRQDLSPELLAHELNHALFTWSIRIGLKLVDKQEFSAKNIGILSKDSDEERFCTAHSYMFVRLFQKLMKAGAFKVPQKTK